MNKLLQFAIFVSILGCQSPEQSKNQVENVNPYSEKLIEYFESLVKLKKFNGAVFVKTDNDIILYQNFNIDQSEIKSLTTEKSSQFDIHSISKLMAKAAVVDLHKEGKISYQDNIIKYIPDFPNGDLITIQQLIDNSSGLPRELSVKVENLIDKNPDELIDLIKKEKLIFEPGSDSSYSNLGYQVLYFILSEITNKPFVQLLNEKYFRPLKMNNTGAHFHLDMEPNNLKNLVKNHELEEENIISIPNIQKEDKNQAKLYSNIEDLIKFLGHIQNSPYSEKLKSKNRNTIGWSGGGDGILSHLEYNLNGKYQLAFFSNYDEIPFGDIVLTIEKIMTNQPYELPKILNRKEKKIDLKNMIAYEGKYRVMEFNNSLFEFKLENDNLVFFQDGVKNTILKAETDSTFFDLPTDEDYFSFRRTEKGEFEVIYYYKKVPIIGIKENDIQH